MGLFDGLFMIDDLFSEIYRLNKKEISAHVESKKRDFDEHIRGFTRKPQDSEGFV